MKAGKVVNFLLLGDAFTSRNITSIGLVIIFFFIFYLAGGKVTWRPQIQNGASLSPVYTEPAPDPVAKSVERVSPEISPAQDPVVSPVIAGEPKAPDTSEEMESEKMRNLRDRLQNLGAKRSGEGG